MEKENNTGFESLPASIASEIDYFRRINGVSLNQISVNSGISVTNLKRMLSDESDISVLALVRIISALWNVETADKKNIVDYLFRDRIKIRKSIYPTVTRADICTTTDYAALIILLWDYFLNGNKHGAEDNLFTIFRALDGEIAIIEAGKGERDSIIDTHYFRYTEFNPWFQHVDIRHMNDPKLYADGIHIDTKKEDENAKFFYKGNIEYKVDKSVLDIHLKSYFDKTFWTPTFISDDDPMFTIRQDSYRPLMMDGETMVWSDVTNFLTQFRAENNKLLKNLQTGEIIHRMENKKSHAYKYNDVMAVDNELEMGGAFFSVCYNATRNSILLSKICTMMDSAIGNFQKKSDQDKFERGIHSFFSMLRYLEEKREVNNSPYKVLSVLRHECFYKDVKEHHNWLVQAVSDFPEFFPANSLEFYEKLPQ